MRVKYIGRDTPAIDKKKYHEVLSIEKGWYRIMTEFEDSYLFPPEVFKVVEGSEEEYTGPYAKKYKNS